MNTKPLSLILGVLAMTGLLSYVVLAWTEPSVGPPGGNVTPPINTGINYQAKDGDLGLRTFYTDDIKIGGAIPGLYSAHGNLIIKNSSNNTTLEIDGSTGNLKVKDSSGVLDSLFSNGIIKEKFLPYCEEEITSDVYTNGQSQATGCNFGGYDGYYNISNLIPENVKTGVSFGRGEIGALEISEILEQGCVLLEGSGNCVLCNTDCPSGYTDKGNLDLIKEQGSGICHLGTSRNNYYRRGSVAGFIRCLGGRSADCRDCSGRGAASSCVVEYGECAIGERTGVMVHSVTHPQGNQSRVYDCRCILTFKYCCP